MPLSLTLPIRLVALVVMLTLWMVQYFIINGASQGRRPRLNSRLAFDGVVPFVPGLIVVYLSTYVFGLLPFLLISDTRWFMATAAAYAAIALVSSTIHVRYPSQIERCEIAEDRSFAWWLITWFQGLCKPYGNFPSTHVAFCVVVVSTGFALGGPALGGLFLAWAALIAWSTLATRQHYLLDILAGTALGIGAAIMVALVV